MKRNTDLDFIRAILIVLMILIHIVSFGNAYPHLKAGILSFMMPTFLIITGYLVNIEKTGRQMGNYLKCLALPYVIMVTGFSVLSYYMPVRDGITELSLSQIGEKIFITSIGPYWFIQTMIICGALYYSASAEGIGMITQELYEKRYLCQPFRLRSYAASDIRDSSPIGKCSCLLLHRRGHPTA